MLSGLSAIIGDSTLKDPDHRLSPVQQFILLISVPTAKLLKPQPSLLSGGQLCFRIQDLVLGQLLAGLLGVDHFILRHLVLLLPDRSPDQGPPPHLRGGGGGDGGGDPDDLPLLLLLLLLLVVLLLLSSERTSWSNPSQAEWRSSF